MKKKTLYIIASYVSLVGAIISGFGALMMFMVGVSLAFQPNLFVFLQDQGLLDATMNQEMIGKLLNIDYFWMIGIYLGLSVVMVFKVISYFLGYRILKNWKNDQWNIQDLIRKTAYCIFATQIISFLLGIIMGIVTGSPLLNVGVIQLDWILAGLFLLCLPQFKTNNIDG